MRLTSCNLLLWTFRTPSIGWTSWGRFLCSQPFIRVQWLTPTQRASFHLSTDKLVFLETSHRSSWEHQKLVRHLVFSHSRSRRSISQGATSWQCLSCPSCRGMHRNLQVPCSLLAFHYLVWPRIHSTVQRVSYRKVKSLYWQLLSSWIHRPLSIAVCLTLAARPID